METLNKLLSIDLNYIVIALFVIFYSLEQILETQFNFKKRGKHFFPDFDTGTPNFTISP